VGLIQFSENSLLGPRKQLECYLSKGSK